MADETLGGSGDVSIESELVIETGQSLEKLKAMISALERLKDNASKAFSTLNKDLKNVSKGMDEVTESTKQDTKATNELNFALNKIGKTGGASLAIIQAKLKANYAIMNTVTRAFGYLIQYTVDFDKELKELQAITATTDAGMVALRNSIVDVANSTKYTSLEITKISTVLGQAGYSVQQIKDVLPGIATLATATGTDLETAVQTVTSAINVYELQASEATRITNALTTAVNESKADISGFQYALQYAGKAANDLNVSLEETAVAVAGATQAGIRSKSTLGTGLRAILVELISPTTKFKAQLQKLGLTMDDVDVKSKGYLQVLKNLKAAGFGAEEAYKGMQRRAASFMTTQLSQIEFMEKLQERMIGSQAAIKANATQMEAFANTWENTKSIMGSAANEGLAPVLAMLQKILKVTNDLIGGNGEWSQLIKGMITATAIITPLTVGFVGLFKILVSISALLKQMQTAGSFTNFLGALSLGKLTLIVAAVTALGVALYSIYKIVNTSKSLSDLKADLEGIQGNVAKAEESFVSFSNSMQNLYTQREKYMGEGGRRQIELFVSEMISRFPQIENVLRKEIATWEELIATMTEAQLKLAEIKYASIEGRSAAQDRITKKTYKDYAKDQSIDSIMKDIATLQNSGILGADQSSQFNQMLRQMGDLRSGASRASFNPFNQERYLFSDKGRQVGLDLLKSISENMRENKDAMFEIEKLLASQGLSEGLRDLLTAIKETSSIRTADQQETLTLAMRKAMGGTELSSYQVELFRTLKLYEGKYQELFTDANMTAEAFVENTQGLVIGIENHIEDLQNKLGSEEFLTYLEQAGYDIEDLMKKTGIESRDKLIEAIKNGNTDLFNQIVGPLRQFIYDTNDMIGKIETYNLNESKKRLQEELRLIQDSYKRTSGKSLKAKQAEADGIIKQIGELEKLQNAENLRKKANGAEMPEFVLAEENARTDKLVQEKIQQNKDKIQTVRDSIDYTSLKIDAFFKSVDSEIKNIGDVFAKKELERQRKYSETEGYMATLRELYGTDYEADNLEFAMKKQQREQDLVAKQVDVAQIIQDYQEQLVRVQEEYDMAALKILADRSQQAYEQGLKNGVGEETLKNLEKTANRTAKNYESVAKTERDLTTKIEENKNELEKLNGNIRALGANKNTPGSTITGIQQGAEKYANSTLQGNFSNLETNMAYMTDSVLKEADAGFKKFFIDISDGADNATDAFKEMGRAMLKTIQDIAMEMAAKQLVAGLVGSIFGGGEAGTGDSSGIGSWFSGLFASSGGMATGGPVNGPISTRDSVAKMLMPGEYIINKSAAETVGRDFLDNLNNGNLQSLQSNSANIVGSGIASEGGQSSKGDSTVNVWVVSEDQTPPPSASDIVVTVSEDIRRGGTLKKLIKSVAAGG